MTDTYRLVFRGEVLEGQHKAVFKQRLGAVLQLEGERLDALFTGKAVTVRKAADSATAARFQVAFKRAGARLRVVPIETQTEPEAASTAPAASVPGFNLAPPGARMQDADTTSPPLAVDTSHLTLAAPGSALGVVKPDVVVTPPDISHLTVAEPGADLQIDGPEADAIPVAVPAWGVAKVGADLAARKPPVEPKIDLDTIDFDVAPAGTRLADEDDDEAPTPPDTSHIQLQ
jgi:hypothetical protein